MINSIGVSSNIYANYANPSNVNFQGKAKASANAQTVSTPIQDAPKEDKKTSNKRFLTSTILLLGGAALGYGHRKYLDKAGECITQKLTALAEKPICQNILAKGSEILNKIKDVVFVKNQA